MYTKEMLSDALGTSAYRHKNDYFGEFEIDVTDIFDVLFDEFVDFFFESIENEEETFDGHLPNRLSVSIERYVMESEYAIESYNLFAALKEFGIHFDLTKTGYELLDLVYEQIESKAHERINDLLETVYYDLYNDYLEFIETAEDDDE